MQHSPFGDAVVIDGFPAKEVGTLDAPPLPGWPLRPGDVDTLVRR